jgi:hypothetical protein
MSFQSGDRVVLLQQHAGFPAGSLGTVHSGGPITAVVNFDTDPGRSVVVPNSILRHASNALRTARQSAFAAKAAPTLGEQEAEPLLWHTPRLIAAEVGAET